MSHWLNPELRGCLHLCLLPLGGSSAPVPLQQNQLPFRASHCQFPEISTVQMLRLCFFVGNNVPTIHVHSSNACVYN